MINKTLDLPLKAQWFEMLKSREKKEEYREIKPYWLSRMFNIDTTAFYASRPDLLKHVLESGILQFQYTHVRTRYGYTKRTELREIESVRIGKGKPEWGAPNKDVIIIRLKD